MYQCENCGYVIADMSLVGNDTIKKLHAIEDHVDTLHGYMVYRLQDLLKGRGHNISYEDISDSLSFTLLALAKDMGSNELIELPNGSMLRMFWKAKIK